MRVSRLFVIALFAFFLFFIRQPLPVRAAGAIIGTHLVQGDPHAEMDVLNQLKTKLAGKYSAHYPVVIMMDATNPGAYTPLAQATHGEDFDPIVRIFNINPTTDPKTMDAIATEMTQFKAGTPVELGNEINNQDPNNGEWKSTDYSNYGRMFDELAGQLSSVYPLGVSAVDTLNSKYDAATILPNILISIHRQDKITAVFANVYQTNSTDQRYTVNSGTWVVNQINSLLGTSLSPENNLYITEFGTVKCTTTGDWDCIQNFYSQNGEVRAQEIVGFTRAPGDVTSPAFYHTVPLICEYWKADGSLAVSKPNQCGSTTGGGIYIYPGIDTQVSTPLKQDMAAHYMMTCGSQIQLSGKIENEDMVDNTSIANFHPADCTQAPGCTVTPTGTVWINHEDSTIPLFRLEDATVPNSNSTARRYNDLEGFFGSIYKGDPKSATYQFTQPLGNGASQKQTSPTYTCTNTMNFLKSIDSLCSALPTPLPSPINNLQLSQQAPSTTNPCALDLAISGTTETYRSVYRKMQQTNYSCDIGAKNDPNVEQLVSQVELTTPKAFRPAYIIHYINYPVDDPDPNQLTKYETWFSPGSSPTQPAFKNRIRITKVYVPANVASQTQDSQISGNNYTSPMMQTLQAMTSYGDQQKIEDQKTKDIAGILSLSNSTNVDPSSPHTPLLGSHVNCPECSDPNSLESILVKRINADIDHQHYLDSDNNDCTVPDVTGEQANQIKQRINPVGNPDPVREIPIGVKATLLAKASGGRDDIVIRTYLLLPEEYRNIQNYETNFTDSLFSYNASTSPKFIDRESQATGTNDIAYKYLQLNDTKPKFGEPGKTIHISSPEASGSLIGYSIDPLTFAVTYEKLKGIIVGPDISKFNVNPVTPGGKLARGLWEVMCHVLHPYTDGLAYAPYPGFEKFLKDPSHACVVSNTAPTCGPTTGGSQPIGTPVPIKDGWLVVAPVNSTFVSSIPNQQGLYGPKQRTCDWAGTVTGGAPSFSINANFFDGAGQPRGPFGSNGKITDNPIVTGTNAMSLMIDKSGNAHVYDWDNRSGDNHDMIGKPDLTQANFVVTGVYYDNFQGAHAGYLPRTVIGLKDNNVYIATFSGDASSSNEDQNSIKNAMAAIGINDGHFVMLDGDTSTQLCNQTTLLFPTGSNYPGSSYFQPVGVSIGVSPASSSGNPGTCSPPPSNTFPSQYFSQLQHISSVAHNPLPPGACGLTYVSAQDAQTYANELLANLPTHQQATSNFAGWDSYYSGYLPGQTQNLFGTCGNESCLKFILDTVTSTPVCNTNTRLNPYIAVSIALNETGGLKNMPNTNGNEHFGCSMAIFSSYVNNGNANSATGPVCTVQTADGRQVINPLVGPPMSDADVNACVPPSAVPTWMLSRKQTTVEDGLACMITRFNSYCNPNLGSSYAQNDVQALNDYGYTSMNNIIGTVMKDVLVDNPTRYSSLVTPCQSLF